MCYGRDEENPHPNAKKERVSMSQSEPKPIPVALNVRFTDASNLPLYHVNALGVRGASDEFFFILGVIQPPEPEDMEKVNETGYVTAQPIYRFAISRANMEKFLTLMANQYEQQTTLINQLRDGETNEEEGSEDE